MKRILFLLVMLTSFSAYSQVNTVEDPIVTDTVPEKKTFGDKLGKFLGIDKEEEIKNLKETVGYQQMMIDSLSDQILTPTVVVKTVNVQVPSMNAAETQSIRKDEKFLSNLPKSYGNLKSADAAKLAREIDAKINELLKQRDSLVKSGSSQELIHAKDNMIQSLEREKNVINLSNDKNFLTKENHDLIVEEVKLKNYLKSAIAGLFVLLLAIAVILQRKRIKVQDVEIDKQISDINKKNNYLEHAAHIIRHDMHSGINTYIPRGIGSLEKRISEETAKELKIDGAIKLIKEGLSHTQKVYKNVYEFTNLVKQNVVLDVEELDLTATVEKHVNSTAYASQVEVEPLPTANINAVLFCTVIDSLAKNGLQYNNSTEKKVKIYTEDDCVVVEDNGIGLPLEEFEKIKKNKNDKGLGLSIALAIIEEHGFELLCERVQTGTKMKIKIK